MTMMTIDEPRLDYGNTLGSGSPTGDHDPAALCARLRELALEAHQAVRTRDTAGPADLSDLRNRVAQLRSNLQAQRLDALAGYVSALERTLV